MQITNRDKQICVFEWDVCVWKSVASDCGVRYDLYETFPFFSTFLIVD